MAESRLNILLTHGQEQQAGRAAALAERPPWYETVAQLLAPMGVRTFEATTGPQAVELIERNPIHLAVVDTRLSGFAGLNVLRVIQKIRERAHPVEMPTEPAAGQRVTKSYRVEVKFEGGQVRQVSQRVEVKFEGKGESAAVWPTVILVTPERDQVVLQEALKCDAFSVMSEPVDLELMLDLMARAMRRFHRNLWPQ